MPENLAPGHTPSFNSPLPFSPCPLAARISSPVLDHLRYVPLRALDLAGPSTWDALPSGICMAYTLILLKSLLKWSSSERTFLIILWFNLILPYLPCFIFLYSTYSTLRYIFTCLFGCSLFLALVFNLWGYGFFFILLTTVLSERLVHNKCLIETEWMEYEIHSLVQVFFPSFIEQAFTNQLCCDSIPHKSFPFLLTMTWSSFLQINRVLQRGGIWATWGISLTGFIAHELSILANYHLPNPCWLVVILASI